MSARRLEGALPALVLALALLAGCSNAPAPGTATPTGRTATEAAFAEQTCMTQLQTYLKNLKVPRMDAFFSAALNGLVRCEADSGLAHLPSRDVTRWLTRPGHPTQVALPAAPAALAIVPHDDAQRLPYQRACMAYMRSYLPASIARAGDEADVAAAFIFNAVEQCDSEAGFATIAPRDLATMMESKHLL